MSIEPEPARPPGPRSVHVSDAVSVTAQPRLGGGQTLGIAPPFEVWIEVQGTTVRTEGVAVDLSDGVNDSALVVVTPTDGQALFNALSTLPGQSNLRYPSLVKPEPGTFERVTLDGGNTLAVQVVSGSQMATLQNGVAKTHADAWFPPEVVTQGLATGWRSPSDGGHLGLRGLGLLRRAAESVQSGLKYIDNTGPRAWESRRRKALRNAPPPLPGVDDVVGRRALLEAYLDQTPSGSLDALTGPDHIIHFRGRDYRAHEVSRRIRAGLEADAVGETSFDVALGIVDYAGRSTAHATAAYRAEVLPPLMVAIAVLERAAADATGVHRPWILAFETPPEEQTSEAWRTASDQVRSLLLNGRAQIVAGIETMLASTAADGVPPAFAEQGPSTLVDTAVAEPLLKYAEAIAAGSSSAQIWTGWKRDFDADVDDVRFRLNDFARAHPHILAPHIDHARSFRVADDPAQENDGVHTAAAAAVARAAFTIYAQRRSQLLGTGATADELLFGYSDTALGPALTRLRDGFLRAENDLIAFARHSPFHGSTLLPPPDVASSPERAAALRAAHDLDATPPSGLPGVVADLFPELVVDADAREQMSPHSAISERVETAATALESALVFAPPFDTFVTLLNDRNALASDVYEQADLLLRGTTDHVPTDLADLRRLADSIAKLERANEVASTYATARGLADADVAAASVLISSKFNGRDLLSSHQDQINRGLLIGDLDRVRAHGYSLTWHFRAKGLRSVPRWTIDLTAERDREATRALPEVELRAAIDQARSVADLDRVATTTGTTGMMSEVPTGTTEPTATEARDVPIDRLAFELGVDLHGGDDASTYLSSPDPDLVVADTDIETAGGRTTAPADVSDDHASGGRGGGPSDLPRDMGAAGLT